MNTVANININIYINEVCTRAITFSVFRSFNTQSRIGFKNNVCHLVFTHFVSGYFWAVDFSSVRQNRTNNKMNNSTLCWSRIVQWFPVTARIQCADSPRKISWTQCAYGWVFKQRICVRVRVCVNVSVKVWVYESAVAVNHIEL